MIAPNPVTPPPPEAPVRILVLGAGFGGIYTAYHLQRLTRHHPRFQIALVSRDNYFLMTPLLFEAGSGILEPRHAVSPIRPLFDCVRFIEADVQRIDFDRQLVHARHAPADRPYELAYDQLVLALGSTTNRKLISGSEHALGFKTLADAIYTRNHIIDLFEQADAEPDPARRQELLTFVVIGAGLVGIELMGELTEFVENLIRSYPRLPRSELRFYVIEATEHVLPEMDRDLADYAAETLRDRGVRILTSTPVPRIDQRCVYLPEGKEGGCIRARTVVLCAGIAPNPLLADLPLEKNKHGRIVVHPTMRSTSRPNIWALGDCAAIPDPAGKPYPPLAQHALREARVLARNIVRVCSGHESSLEPFVYKSLGTLASLGHYAGAGRVWDFKLRGFAAWWVWRTYYLMQMPRLARRMRIMMDWTIGLLFGNDVVKLDTFGAPDWHPPLPPAPMAEEPPAAERRTGIPEHGQVTR